MFNGFSNMVLANAMEPLRDVKLRSPGANFSWRVTTLDGGPVFSSSGLKISPDLAFDPDESGRKLILIAGYQVRELIAPDLLGKLRRAARNVDMVIAVDSAPWLLAAAGLLDGHTATIHWQELDAFEEGFPKVKTSVTRYVRSGRFLTCGGASAALDMMLDLIHQLFGSAAAFEASNMFVFDREKQTEINQGPQRLQHKCSPKVLMALNEMAENMETPLTTFELAAKVSLSERAFNRTFVRELGITPGKYYRMFRLQRARYLAEETELSAEQIAMRCGFSTASSLARSLSNTFGVSIRELRQPNKLWRGPQSDAGPSAVKGLA
ncbi:GlxA family transcriptional regulator [Lentibacter algarum]|uniref:GlxA family transcriptional regulator n=1 Tax=Lentibacter algarum TaxID=576131 RepID=UPI002090D3D3|nr:helix-turn-helix domain-containing protein [Lentibacter algarum]